MQGAGRVRARATATASVCVGLFSGPRRRVAGTTALGLGLVLLAGCGVQEVADGCAPGWQLVFRNDTQGEALTGSRDALFDAVRRGAPIRMAWGVALPERDISVEHAAEPVFVSITGGRELFAQLPEHIAQRSYWDPAASRFEESAVMWRGLLGTDGSFDAVWVDRASGREVRRVPQRARVAWFVQESCGAAAPVDLAAPGGVVLDEG